MSGTDETTDTAGALELCILLWIAYCIFATMYSPQPLLQSISEDLNIRRSSAGLLLTVTILPLSFAPLLYGMFLDRISLRPLLFLGMLAIGAVLLPPAQTDDYPLFLGMRLIQGFITPAMLLGLMLYIATHYSGAVMQRTLALYTAITMVGSFSGRLLCGYMASVTSWRGAFLLLACLAATAAFASLLLRKEKKANRQQARHISPREFIDVLKQEDVRKVILCAPLCIFVHASILNFIPFYMHDLDNSVSELGIALIYVSALICSLLGIFSRHVVPRLGGEIRTVIVGLSLFIIFTPLILLRSPLILFISLFGSSAGFALVYTTSPGIVNRASTSGKAVTNGVYLTTYYLFGASGTYFPVLIYATFGLTPYVLFLISTIVLALGITLHARSVQAHLQK